MNVVERRDLSGCGCEAHDMKRGLISIDHALHLISEAAFPSFGNDVVPLDMSVGRVLSRPEFALTSNPPFDNSAMDGYAIDTSSLVGEGPWCLEVKGRVSAGQSLGCDQGGAVRVFTGAPMPSWANAVIMQENVERLGDTICFSARPLPGLNVRRRGEDIRKGDLILSEGLRISPKDVAALAAAGIGEVVVKKPIRVALLVTGDEVQSANHVSSDAHICDVNSPMLRAVISRPSAHITHVTFAEDDRQALAAQIARLSKLVDLIVTTGGLSVGEADFVKPALLDAGGLIYFSGVAIKPGKPVSFGRVGDALWLGLPGNPVAALVTWTIFGEKLFASLAGSHRGTKRRNVVLLDPVQNRGGRCELRLARLGDFDETGREVVTCPAATHSARVAGLIDADGLILIPAETDSIPRGGLVEFLPFAVNN